MNIAVKGDIRTSNEVLVSRTYNSRWMLKWNRNQKEKNGEKYIWTKIKRIFSCFLYQLALNWWCGLYCIACIYFPTFPGTWINLGAQVNFFFFKTHLWFEHMPSGCTELIMTLLHLWLTHVIDCTYHDPLKLMINSSYPLHSSWLPYTYD